MNKSIQAILWKQSKDTLKNKAVLIQFILFPLMTIVMENAMNMQDMPAHFFVNLFGIMYVGMAPLTSIAAIIAEEKEKNTLCVLKMCNVRAAEYLIGNAIYIITICMIGSLVMGLAGGYTGMNLFRFMLLMFVGHICSFLLGATIGLVSKNQMTATSINVPVMMVLSFLPMLSMFNETIKKFSKFLFSEQLYLLVNHLEQIKMTWETGFIMMGNIILIVAAFFVIYKKQGYKRL